MKITEVDAFSFEDILTVYCIATLMYLPRKKK